MLELPRPPQSPSSETMATKTSSGFAREVGERLARLRRMRGLTQVELARRLRWRQYEISQYERGFVRLHAEAIVVLAHALRVRPDEILGFPKRARSTRALPRQVASKLQEIATLPKRDREALLRTIDTYLVAHSSGNGLRDKSPPPGNRGRRTVRNKPAATRRR